MQQGENFGRHVMFLFPTLQTGAECELGKVICKVVLTLVFFGVSNPNTAS